MFLEDYERDQHFAMSDQFKPPDTDRKSQYAAAERRLNGYCRGLVEVGNHIRVGKCVIYTHRSIPEFLQRPRIKEEKNEYLLGFNTETALSQLLLADLQSIKSEHVDAHFWSGLIYGWIMWVYQERSDHAQFTLLSPVDLEMTKKIPMRDFEYLSKTAGFVTSFEKLSLLYPGDLHLTNGNRYITSVFEMASCLGFFSYVGWKLGSDRTFLEEYDESHLRRCLNVYQFTLLYFDDESTSNIIKFGVQPMTSAFLYPVLATGSVAIGWIRYIFHEVFHPRDGLPEEKHSPFMAALRCTKLEKNQTSFNYRTKFIREHLKNDDVFSVFEIQIDGVGEQHACFEIILTTFPDWKSQPHTLFKDRTLSVEDVRRCWGSEEIKLDILTEDAEKEHTEQKQTDKAASTKLDNGCRSAFDEQQEGKTPQDDHHTEIKQISSPETNGSEPASPNITTKEPASTSLVGVSRSDRSWISISSHVLTFVIGMPVFIQKYDLAC